MATRHKPMFYRRKKRVMPGLVAVLSLTALVIWFMARSGGPLAGLAENFSSLYQWIPAAVMWLILLVMLSMAMFAPKRDE